MLRIEQANPRRRKIRDIKTSHAAEFIAASVVWISIHKEPDVRILQTPRRNAANARSQAILVRGRDHQPRCASYAWPNIVRPSVSSRLFAQAGVVHS